MMLKLSEFRSTYLDDDTERYTVNQELKLNHARADLDMDVAVC